MTDPNEFEALLEWCREAAKDTRTHLVEDTDWGFCARHDTNQYVWFAWFDSAEALFHYFANCWGYDRYAPAETLENDPALPLKAARYSEYVRQFLAEEIDEDTLLARLSQAYPDVTLHWIGTLEEILYGDSSFAREWRAEFRGKDILEGDGPIEDDESDDVLQVMQWPLRIEPRIRQDE